MSISELDVQKTYPGCIHTYTHHDSLEQFLFLRLKYQAIATQELSLTAADLSLKNSEETREIGLIYFTYTY